MASPGLGPLGGFASSRKGSDSSALSRKASDIGSPRSGGRSGSASNKNAFDRKFSKLEGTRRSTQRNSLAPGGGKNGTTAVARKHTVFDGDPTKLTFEQLMLSEEHKITGYALFRGTFDTRPDRRTDEQCDSLKPLLERVTAFHSLLGEVAPTRALARRLKLVTVPWGGVDVIKEGDVGDCMFFVLAGRFSVSVSDKDGKQNLVGVAKGGDVIGEAALREKSVRNGTVTSMEASELLRVDLKDYDQLLRHNDDNSDHKSKVEALKRYPALRCLRPGDFQEMAKRIFFQTYSAGEHLWNQGEMFDSMRFFPLVLRGEVTLLQEVPVVVKPPKRRDSKVGFPAADSEEPHDDSEDSSDDDSAVDEGGDVVSQLHAPGSAVRRNSASFSPTREEQQSTGFLRSRHGAEVFVSRDVRTHELHHEIQAAAALRSLRRRLYKATKGRQALFKGRQVGICTVGPAGCVLEHPMLAAAFESPAAKITDWGDASFFSQKHGCTVMATMRSEVGWLSRYFLNMLLHENPDLNFHATEWALKLPTDDALQEMVSSRALWGTFRRGLVQGVLRESPRGSRRLQSTDRAQAYVPKPRPPPQASAISKRITALIEAEAAADVIQQAAEADFSREALEIQAQQQLDASLAMQERSANLLKRTTQQQQKRDRLADADRRKAIATGGPAPTNFKGDGAAKEDFSWNKWSSAGAHLATATSVRDEGEENSKADALDLTMLPFRHPMDQQQQFVGQGLTQRDTQPTLDFVGAVPTLKNDLPTATIYDLFPDSTIHPGRPTPKSFYHAPPSCSRKVDSPRMPAPPSSGKPSSQKPAGGRSIKQGPQTLGGGSTALPAPRTDPRLVAFGLDKLPLRIQPSDADRRTTRGRGSAASPPLA